MRGVERIKDLTCVFGRFLHRQWSFLRHAINELHYKEVRSDVVQRADVWMIELRDHTGFASESFSEIRFGNFDSNHAIEPRIAGLVYLAHTARAEGGDDLIRPEFCSGGQRHTEDSVKFIGIRKGIRNE